MVGHPLKSGSRLIGLHGSLGSPESSSQTVFLSVQLFCRVHERDQQTDRQTDHTTPLRVYQQTAIAS